MSAEPRKNILWLLIPALLLGLFAGGLMTWHHDVQLYGGAQVELIGCEESAEVNCDIVNTSEYSELLGVPLATWAIPFYGLALFLTVIGARGDEKQAQERAQARGMLAGMGVAAALLSGFLFYISKTQLGYVCAWCIRMYAVNAAILVLPLVAGRLAAPVGLAGRAGGIWLALMVLAGGGERLWRMQMGGGDGKLLASGGKQGDHSHDPEGKAPTIKIMITTEDKNERELVLEPDDAWTGNPKAKVTVVMFGDLQCGYCKRSSAELKRLEEAYGDRVLFVFKHFPMDPSCNPGVKNNKHRYACNAAVASVCAQDQGRFWAFHDLAYKNQHQLGSDYLRTYALQSGVDGAAWDACVAGREAKARVRADAEAGTALDIHGTPRIFINGQLYRSGTSAEVMARAIEQALGATAEDAAKAASSMKENQAVSAIAADIPTMQTVTVQTITAGAQTFRIDTFEAAIIDGKAVSGKHNVPAIGISWEKAKAACEAAGKRLCTEPEWVAACQGAAAVDDNGNGEYADDMIEGNAYPYGDFHEPGRCWDGREGKTRDTPEKPGEEYRPVYTGEMPGCATPTGVYDLTGNVEEWVGDAPERAALIGGAWDTSEDHARCYRRNDTFGAGYASVRTGFRCCASP